MDGAAYIQRAYDFIWKNDFEQAIFWFEQAIVAEPENADYHYRCAISCTRSGKWRKAQGYAARACELSPGQPDYSYQLSLIEARLLVAESERLLAPTPNLQDNLPSVKAEKRAKAEELLMRAAQHDPLCFDAHYLLGMLYAEKGDLHAALQSCREALMLNSQHAAARTLYVTTRREIRKKRKSR